MTVDLDILKTAQECQGGGCSNEVLGYAICYDCQLRADEWDDFLNQAQKDLSK